MNTRGCRKNGFSRSKMMKTLKTNVLASGFWRLKAPRWHLGALWVSDVRAGKVFRIDLDGKVTIVADVPSRPFGLGFLPDGDLLVASMTQRLILKFGAEKSAVYADMADVAVRISAGHGRRPGRKRLCDFFRCRRCGSGLLRVGPGSSGDAGRQDPFSCRQHGASERVGDHKRA